MTNSTANDPTILTQLSDAMAAAVERAGAGTLLVNARRRMPASGIGYTSEMILTANHVVEREEDISIMLPDGTETQASLAGRDPGSDLAVLKLQGTSVAVVQPAPDDARVGQLVLALGRPSADGIQASLGVVSAMGGPVRTARGGLLERYLRTDAIPYPGFSGGPLVDTAGQVVGINTSGLARGASLAIPVSSAWQIAETLSRHGHVRRGFLGVRSQPVEIPPAQQDALGRQQESGLLLVGVERGSPADQGGLLIGDIIVALAGKAVTDPDELLAHLTGDIVGKPTKIEVLRGGQPQSIEVTIGDRGS
jgi:S1-C subfamily serine protease